MKPRKFYVFEKDSIEKLSPHFNAKEFVCKCSYPHPVHIALDLIERLEILRTLVGRSIYISGPFRCGYHNAHTKNASINSQHMCGTAVDIKLKSYTDLSIDRFAELAEQAGFDGIGKYGNRIHVDVRGSKARWDNR